VLCCARAVLVLCLCYSRAVLCCAGVLLVMLKEGTLKCSQKTAEMLQRLAAPRHSPTA